MRHTSPLARRKAAILWSGTIDGRILPRQLVDVFDRGEQAKVPLLVGFNSGETRSLRMLVAPLPPNASAYETLIRDRYADLADAFLKLYPATDLEESALAATRDAMYGWTAERLAAKQAALGEGAFLYYFDHGYPAADAAGLHGFHGSELPYVFGTVDGTPALWPRVPAEPAELTLSAAMIAYWAAFARDGVPQAGGQPHWQPYSSNRSSWTSPILRSRARTCCLARMSSMNRSCAAVVPTAALPGTGMWVSSHRSCRPRCQDAAYSS